MGTAVFWVAIKKFWSKYWPYIVALLILLMIAGYVWYLKSCISGLEKERDDWEAAYTEQAYDIALLNSELSGRDKEISYYKEKVLLLEDLKEREVIREKHYHTQVENNKTIIEKYDEDKDLFPIFCKIDSYFGADPDSRCFVQ
jgi:hypothetical protein